LADLLVIKGASTRSSGWTFHDQRAATRPAALTPAPESTRTRTAILTAIKSAAARHQNNQALAFVGLNPDAWQTLYQAMIEAESAYNPSAQSPVGAYGLGQLMPDTAQALGVDRRDMAQNLDGAARYLLAQLAKFRNVDLALAAYNAGPHSVIKYHGVPPFSETRNYIARVNRISARLLRTPPPNALTQPAQSAAPPWPALVLKLN